MAQNLDTYRLPKFEELDSPLRFDALATLFDKAEQEGAIASLPGSEEQVRKKELHESRVRTIRTRLYMLGYLGRDNGKPEIDDRLKQAIGQFQKEAGLLQDRWVGAKTWTALQEIVSFEHPRNLEKWFAAGKANPALLRAVKLRLFVLGFLPSKQADDTKKLDQALEHFVLVARILNLHDALLAPALTPQTLAVLFDQDGITERLGKAGRAFQMHWPSDVPRKQAQQSVRKFIICCAKVELWLLGYDVPLDGSARFSPPDRTPYVQARYPLYHALYTFWVDQGQSDGKAQELARGITGSFFRTLSRIQQQGARIADPNVSEYLYEILAQEDDRVLDQVWTQIKSIGSRIWDGVKRVWRWFKSVLRKGVKILSAWVKNLARLAYQYALNAFPIVGKIINVTSAAVSVLVHQTLPESDIRHIVVHHDGDFDYRLYLNPNRDRQTVSTILEKFLTQAHLFQMGMRVLGLLIGALITVIKRVARAGGWFGLVLALVRIYSKLKELDAVLDEEEAFLAVA